MEDEKARYVLLVDPNHKDTKQAKQVLDKTGIPYRLAYGDIGEEPQLLTGFKTWLGLEGIARLAGICANRRAA